MGFDMGIWDRITNQAAGQFLDVIQWLDTTNDTLVWRYPVRDQAITDQSSLVVREGQAAVFVAEGVLSDVFAPGTYTLDTPNAPLVTFFRSIAYGMQTPYKGDVLFVSTRQFTDNGWGTQNPFMMRDAEFGPVRVRAFGTFSFRILDPATFIRQIVGTDGRFTADEITSQLKKRVVSAFATAVSQAKVPVLDLAAHYTDLGDRLRDQMNPEFEASYGLKLTDLTIANISLPPEVEKALDARSKMGILGDLNAYTKLQSADAIAAAATQQGGAGAGVGLGMGMGVGHAMAATMGQAVAAGGAFDPQQGLRSATPPPVPGATTLHYHGPDGQSELAIDQIVQRIAAQRDAQHLLWGQGWPAWKPWREVPEVAVRVPPEAPTGPPPLPGAATTYTYAAAEGQVQATAEQIAQAASQAPGSAHLVWRQGWDGWRAAADVPEIAALMAPPTAGPPPLPE